MNSETTPPLTVRQALAFGPKCGWQANAGQIAASCPIEYFKENPWSRAAAKLYSSPSGAGLKWKTIDPKVREVELLAILCLLSSFWLDLEVKLAIAGWMLSEVLSEEP